MRKKPIPPLWVRLCGWLGDRLPWWVGNRLISVAEDWHLSHSPEFIETITRLNETLSSANPEFWAKVRRVSGEDIKDEIVSKGQAKDVRDKPTEG